MRNDPKTSAFGGFGRCRGSCWNLGGGPNVQTAKTAWNFSPAQGKRQLLFIRILQPSMGDRISKMTKTLSLVIPCYNEAARIDQNAFIQAVERWPWISFCFANFSLSILSSSGKMKSISKSIKISLC